MADSHVYALRDARACAGTHVDHHPQGELFFPSLHIIPSRQQQQQAESRLAQDPPKTAMSTWLPYTLIDQLLVATNEQSQSDLSNRAMELRRDLHREVSNGARRAQKQSHRLYQEL